MIKYNKYLKELGLKETDFPFDMVEGNDHYIEDEDGFRKCEFFSLDYSLSLYIYSQLCYFRDNCVIGCPDELSERYGSVEKGIKKWKEILDDMIEAFRLIILATDYLSDFYKNPREKRYLISKNRNKKINKGLRYFIKYYQCLWY